MGNETGQFVNTPIIENTNLYTPEGTCLDLDSPVVAASFDKSNKEGLIGTMSGTIRYINWAEGSNIRLSTSHINGPA